MTTDRIPASFTPSQLWLIVSALETYRSSSRERREACLALATNIRTELTRRTAAQAEACRVRREGGGND